MRNTKEKKLLVGLLILLVSVIIPLTTTAQKKDYLANIQHFSIEEGLSHRTIFSIHEDRRDFIWVGTQYGLNRFDGHEFKWFTREKNGLSSNEIDHILEDQAGNLWLFDTQNWYYKRDVLNITKFNPYTEEVVPMGDTILNDFPILDFEGFLSSPNKTLYFGSKGGSLIRYDLKSGFQEQKVLETKQFILEFYTENHTIWATTDDHTILEIDTLGKILRKIPWEKDTIDHLQLLNIDDKGNLHFVIYRDDNKFKYQSSFINYLDVNDKIHIIPNQLNETLFRTNDWSRQLFHQPSNGFYWLKSLPQLFVFHPTKGMIYNFADHHQELTHSDVREIYFDKKGRIWIGTFNGLYLANLYQNPFTRYLYLNPELTDPASFYSCRGILEDNGELFFNTYKGVIHLQGQTQTKFSYIPFMDNEGLLLYHPHSIYLDKNNNRWFGDFALIKQDRKTKQFQHWNFNTGAGAERVWAINEDKNRTIWLGTEEDGLFYLDTTKNLCVQFKAKSPYESLNKTWVKAIIKDPQGLFWVATNFGLYLLDPQKEVINRYWLGGEADNQLPTDDIRHLHIDKDEIIWLATYGAGLLKMSVDRKNWNIEKIEQFTIADGLSNNNLYAVYEDNHQQLWISSDKGIIQFNKATYKNRAYLPKDGTTHHEFNTISHFQGKDGQLYFGSLNGVTSFHPSELTGMEEVYEIPLIVTSFQKFDKKTKALTNHTQAFLDNRKIVLRPGERFFDLGIALLDYENANQLRYAWKIDGVHDDWQLTTDHHLKISGLPYGRLTLHIKGQGADGRFSTQQLSIPIYVKRPFYLQWWFMVLGVLFFVISGPVYYKWRTTQLLNRQIELEKQVKERTTQIQTDKHLIETQNEQLEEQAAELRNLDAIKSRFFANVSHELRTPLTLMLAPINSAIRSNQLNNRNFTFLSIAQQNGKKLLKLISEILDLSKLESNKLELHEAPTFLYPLTRRLVAAFESYAETNQITFELHYKAERELQVALDAHKYETILNNLLSNAFKFTPKKGTITVGVEDLANSICLSVIDSGRGIHSDDLPYVFDRFYQTKRPNAAAEGGTGIGLALCQEFAKLQHGKMRVESTLGEGSCFYFDFPKKEIFAKTTEITQQSIDLEEELQNELAKTALTKESVFPFVPSRKEVSLLVVEDNMSLRTYLSTILDNYTVHLAENGAIALDWLANNPTPSLIISDVMMPIMDGFQLLTKLKTTKKYQQIPIVMLTARAELRDRLKALRIGVDDYITKPFVEEELIVRIENLLKNAENRKTISASPVEETKEFLTKKEPIVDTKWLEILESTILEKLSNADFSIDSIAEELQISRRQMHRRIKSYIGQTPNQYIKTLRLTKARTLLEDNTYSSVKEVSFAVGFRDPKYFSVQFKKVFGRLPSEYF